MTVVIKDITYSWFHHYVSRLRTLWGYSDITSHMLLLDKNVGLYVVK